MSRNLDNEGQPDIDHDTGAYEPPRSRPVEPQQTPIDNNEARTAEPATGVSETSNDAEETAAPAQSCVMMGLVKSGKTTLLTAIKRACDLPSKDGLKLEFIPAKATAKEIKIAIDQITGKTEGHKATEEVKTFPFQVHVTVKPRNFWSAPLEVTLDVELNDGGGEFLLPSTADSVFKDQREALIESALKATSLILCVDITNPGAITLEKELPITFSDMARDERVRSVVHWTTKLKCKLSSRPIPKGELRFRKSLNADRFLLLLTQIDKISAGLPDSAGRAIDFARKIDPIAQAKELLGVTTLATIRNFLKPSARFAVGIISAMGFNPISGAPFADVDGTPFNLHSEGGDSVLRRWTPFGIRDAMYFLATGICRGTVKELTVADLENSDEPLDFSYSASPEEEGIRV
jgi:hypothetical protein